MWVASMPLFYRAELSMSRRFKNKETDDVQDMSRIFTYINASILKRCTSQSITVHDQSIYMYGWSILENKWKS